ncbi:MAG: hypothetical protein QF733_01580 [Phycisphaerales bacterium]|nr:hypothetical protein [Phycisphaerales bacterium]
MHAHRASSITPCRRWGPLAVLLWVAWAASVASGGAFSVTVQESPRVVLEGIATPLGDGTARVDAAWYLDASPAGVGMVPLRAAPGSPWVDIRLYMIADIDPDTGEVRSYTKYAVLDVNNVDYPDSPVPNGLGLMASVPPGDTGGWAWAGIHWTDEATMTDAIAAGDGSPTPDGQPQACEYIPELEHEIRQIIELGNGRWLVVVVRNGEVYLMVYEEDPVYGCWRFGFSPQLPGGPGGGWWGASPDHTLAESLTTVYEYLIMAIRSHELIGLPGGPVGLPD